MKWWLGPLALVGLSCTRASEPFQMPTGRLLSGVVRCDAEQRCDAGTCFISLFDRAPTCTGAGKSPCEVMQCDAPAQCKCLKTTPPQCGCAVTFGSRPTECLDWPGEA